MRAWRSTASPGRTGIAHVSCLAREAKITSWEAEENNLSDKTCNEM